mgnify:CR=1 FL=1|jgi:Do/DeqQ family serine protease
MKKQFGILILTAFTGAIFAIGIQNLFFSKKTYAPDSEKINYPAYKTSLPLSSAGTNVDFIQAADMTVHAVVHIRTQFQRRTSLYDDFFGFFSNPFGGTQVLQAAGSGVIISSDGYIVTNNHVVSEAEKIEVTLNDKRNYSAKIIGTDPSTDLALLKIDANDLPTIPYGNSDDVKVGEWVLAVGNPFNLTSTVTAGIVSAKARNINILGKNSNESPIESFIQTDAAVNQGNSGGALVNTKGELIGINAAIASSTGSYSGYSFAIPVNIVRKVMEDLKQFGIVQRAYLGVSIAEIDSKIFENKKLKYTRGVYVGAVIENGAAANAGIKEGDIITAVNGKEVNSNSELLEAIGQYRPSDKVVISLIRGNDNLNLNVVLQNQFGKTELIKKDEKQVFNFLGASFEALSDEMLSKNNLPNGVMLTKLNNSGLRNVGIREGFIIISINKQPIRNVNDLKQFSNKRGQIIISGTYPGDWRTYYYMVNL